jgi:LysR family transcriptional regulator, nod-box dependent transcriptional activator
MHLHRLDLNLLVALDALLTEQSVTRAASRLFISQPAMSGALTRLREHFQDELVVRAGRSMVLTPFGASLAPRVTELLADINTVVRSRPGFDPATTDRIFTIVASEYLLSVFMPHVTTRILERAPGVLVNMQLRALDHEQRMASGQVDAMLTVGGLSLVNHPTAGLFRDEYVCVAWEGNTEIGDVLTMETFLACRHAVRAMARDSSHTLEEGWLNMQGHEREVALRVPSFEALPRVVIGTNLIAPMQRRLAELSAQHYPIRILEHPAKPPPLEALLQWPSFREDDAGNRWLRALIIETAREVFGDA